MPGQSIGIQMTQGSPGQYSKNGDCIIESLPLTPVIFIQRHSGAPYLGRNIQRSFPRVIHRRNRYKRLSQPS